MDEPALSPEIDRVPASRELSLKVNAATSDVILLQKLLLEVIGMIADAMLPPEATEATSSITNVMPLLEILLEVIEATSDSMLP